SSTDSSHIRTTSDSKIADKLQDESGFTLEVIDGEKCIITYYPSKYNGWKYLSVIPLKAITTETAYIGKISVIMCIAAVIVFVLLTYVVASGITVPITKMTQYMRDVKIKEWTPRMHYDGNDEIAFMSESFNEMVTRINNLIEELYEQKYRQKKHELQALQAQINPHFLNNTLEIINCMALSRNAPEIGGMVKALARMMRYSIDFKESIVTIERELQHLKNYLFIQCEKNSDRMRVIYDIDERIYPYKILKLSLQPIAENAIIHAFKNTRSENIIAIDGAFINEKIRIRIMDNGNGMDQKTMEHLLNDEDDEEKVKQSNKNYTGIGIGNVNGRLKLTFGEEYGLKVISEVSKGTTVEVWLPTEI
ncbi:MAG: histidine kinase, partial [Clostridiaceae bacterium]|nr:histidine kinase [Clostridiaceae bacterium]